MAALVTILAGCSHAVSSHPAKSLELTSTQALLRAPSAASADDAAFAKAPTRVAGDYVVYRFSGAFHKGAVTLTEKVLEAAGPILLVELTLTGGKNDGTLRVRFDTTPSAKTDVLSVVRVDAAGAEKPSTMAAYEALMSETVFAADQNEEVLGTESIKIAIGSKTFDCVQTRYSVIVGRKKGVLSTIASNAFAWGDVGGELKTNDGKLVYRIDIVDAGHEKKISEAVAGNP